ncbi:wsc domain-containing protein [Phlyctema vagabunda]|uniref:Wsc domain-containing protein n=1 Tax=Phlyctema vagabunda TaxID=108571 RepID=A0ABR4PQH3_9HELO
MGQVPKDMAHALGATMTMISPAVVMGFSIRWAQVYIWIDRPRRSLGILIDQQHSFLSSIPFSILLIIFKRLFTMVVFNTFAIASVAITYLSSVNAAVLVGRTGEPAQPSCTDYTPYVYSGCYTDPAGTEGALLYRWSAAPTQNMTVMQCTAFCKGNDYRYAGLEYYGQCYCGASVHGVATDESKCSYPCTGDKTEACGGSNIISVYSDPTFPTVDSTAISNYKSLGCYSETSSGRTLAWPQKQIAAADMTVNSCLSACRGGGFDFAGVEYGQECYCGVVLGNGTQALSDSTCNKACKGDSTQICGGSSALNLYVATDMDSTKPCQAGPYPSASTSSSTASSTTSTSTSATDTSSTASSSTSTSSVATTSSESSTVSTSATDSSTSSTGVASSSSSSATSSSASTSTVTTTSASSSASSSVPTTSSSCTTTSTSSSTSSSIPTTTSTCLTSSTSSSASSSVPTTTSTSSTLISSTSSSVSTSASTVETTFTSSSASSSVPTTTSTSSSTSSSTSNTSPTITRTSSSSIPTTSATLTIPSTTSFCTKLTTVTPVPSCEYKCGNWCSSPMPDFSDSKSCGIAAEWAAVQVASCFLSAGWPESLKCFEFAGWCSTIKTYCSSSCPGKGCSRSSCKSKYPPVNPNPAPVPAVSVSTSVYPCAPTSAVATTAYTSTTTSTSVPVPTSTNICTQPSNSRYGYTTSSPLGDIPMPCLTCNNLRLDFNVGNIFKLYISSDTNSCKSYKKPSVSDACEDACDAQYTSCKTTYSNSCRSNSFWSIWFGGKDSYDSANSKCYQQWKDCYAANKQPSTVGRCSSWNSGWS